jgi:CheY-like chemotaxis protein
VRTLVVDDEEDMRLLVKTTIDRANEGLLVEAEAADGDQAIELWRASLPDAIVLDERMPGLTGLQVAEIILGERPEQVILLFSAYLTAQIEKRATEMGIRECIPKGEYRSIPDALWRHTAAG